MANQHTPNNQNQTPQGGPQAAPQSSAAQPAGDPPMLTQEEIEQRERQIERRIRRHRILLRIILVLAILVALGIVIVWKVFTVEKVQIEGNRLHSKASIQKTILSDKYSWNSLYVYGKYRFFDHSDEFPYADSVEISLKNPHVLQVDVREKEMIGYLYDSSSHKYVGFDETGEVIYLTDKEPESYIRIAGMKPEQIKLYENMKLEDDTTLTFIKSVTAVLENYQLRPDSIYIQKNGNMILTYGSIQVNLGDSFYLNEKIVRMQQLLEKLGSERSGMLHLETWTEETTDVYFRKDEKVNVPGS